MKYLIFADGRKVPIQSVEASAGVMHIHLIQQTGDDLKKFFDNPAATKRMTVSDNGRESEPYENYTIWKYNKEETGGIWEVELQQEGKDTATRIAELEESNEELKKANKELQEQNAMLTECILEMSEQVYR